MKTVSKRVGEIKRGDIIREPMGQTLYHRVKGMQREGEAVTIFVDGGRGFASDINDQFYVLEDEPAPIVLDSIALA